MFYMDALRQCTTIDCTTKNRILQTGGRLKTKESSLCFREDLLLPIEASPVSAHCHDALHDALQRIALDRQLMSYVPRRVHSAFARTYFCPLRHPQFQLTAMMHYIDALQRI